MSGTDPTTMISEYQLRLDGFEGPLDVLLQLIERQRLDISELSLMAVTDGFLEHIESMKDPSPRLLGEFVGIAARLLVLKSRSLLPRPVAEENEEDIDDLAERLRAYQRIKQVAANMRESQQSSWTAYGRSTERLTRSVNVTLQTPDAGTLHALFVRALARQPSIPDIAPIRPVITVAEMAGRILTKVIRPGRRLLFFDIVRRSSRSETVAGFVALLTLWSRRELEVSQQDLFGAIELRAASKAENDTGD
jgi:segregation and condensation protein A